MTNPALWVRKAGKCMLIMEVKCVSVHALHTRSYALRCFSRLNTKMLFKRSPLRQETNGNKWQRRAGESHGEMCAACSFVSPGFSTQHARLCVYRRSTAFKCSPISLLHRKWRRLLSKYISETQIPVTESNDVEQGNNASPLILLWDDDSAKASIHKRRFYATIKRRKGRRTTAKTAWIATCDFFTVRRWDGKEQIIHYYNST